MEFFTKSIETTGGIVVGLGAILTIWGIINLLEGYSSDNPGAKSQGVKQVIAGGGITIVGLQLIPLLSSIFSI